jgi:(1->4)-alpha-D-glucan 1-alpha-D-glucosylmutase
MPDPRNTLPQSTYRLQLTPDFGFEAAAAHLDYMSALGISHLHSSPCLQADAGSTHGYDVVDQGRPNVELGGCTGLKELCVTLAARGLGYVLDIVPNHMAVNTPQNRLWWNVLKHGPRSTYASFFDIDWDPPDEDLKGRILLPILGADLATVLREGTLRRDTWNGEPVLRYYDQVMPLCPESVDAGRGDDIREMQALIDQQHYLPACWKEAATRINYRRFFALNSLAGIRVEEEPVFQATHRTVLAWVAEGSVDGLRIDHPDGLRDPLGYLRHLVSQAPSAWVVVEKILDLDEALPSDWPVAGTTGYDFLNHVSGLFVDPEGEGPLTRLYHAFTGEFNTYEEVLYQKKHAFLDAAFGAETRKLGQLLAAVTGNMSTEAHDVLGAVIAAFPVYRTYARDVDARIGADDRNRILLSIDAARKRLSPSAHPILLALQRVLLDGLQSPAAIEFRMRFQQLCAPVMAKGGEDTALYCFNRLISLNEVGGNPGTFGIGPERFHAFCSRIQQDWPRTMTTTATHDTKRGEDTRLRIHALSEIPDTWRAAVERWFAWNSSLKRADGPDRNTEYFLYQTLVGTWPIEPERLIRYMEKAIREAKVHTNWETPLAEYEETVSGFVNSLLASKVFIDDLERFLGPVVRAARISSLAQTLLKCAAPGVPDIYQGTELWDLNLVDPDNRRPVDFELRSKRLQALDVLPLDDLCDHMDEGLPKMWVLRQTLRLRRDRPGLFGAEASYIPLYAEGAMAHHLVAFARGRELICLVPRLVLRRGWVWDDTDIELPRGPWENVMTSERVEGGRRRVADLLQRFPVALLVRASPKESPA